MARLSKIVPAILTDDSIALETMVRQAEGFTNYVQFDIMDGQFVPSCSITDKHLAVLPMRLSWEAHLMVERPEDYLGSFREAGAKKVIFHYEATVAPGEVISRARNLGLEVGLAVNPETTVVAILSLVRQVDSVLLLAVHPGFYGSKFIPEVLDKVGQLRAAEPAVEIGVDGGVKEGNVAQIAGLGVDILYVGSAIFMQPEPGGSFRRLQLLAQEGSRHRS